MPYTAQGVHFNGSTSLKYSSAFSGAVDGPSILFSFWAKQEGSDGADQWILSGAGSSFIHRDSSNKMVFHVENSSFDVAYDITSSASFLAGGGWHHFMGSGNGTTGSLYIDGASAGTPFIGNFTMNYTAGGDRYLVNQFVPWTGDLADVYINLNAYLDLTNSTNRAKFITSGGAAVDLGSDGSTPTGSTPTMFFHGAVSGWETNDGSGGGFSVSSGSLSAASTNPPTAGGGAVPVFEQHYRRARAG